MLVRLTFIGAAEEATGSCFPVVGNGMRFLVDCGCPRRRGSRERNLEAWAAESGLELWPKMRLYKWPPSG